MPRGGRRSGAPGKSYGNRTDLNQRPAIVRIPGQEYGAQAAQVRAQQSVPVGPTPAPTPQVPLPTSGAVAGAPTGTTPIPLDAPTTRPNEPLTAGAPVGPGPGPAAPLLSEDMDALRAWMPALEILASSPNASEATRMMVREIRGRLR